MENRITVRNIDHKTWLEFRAEATRQGKNAGDLLTDLMKGYLKNGEHKEKRKAKEKRQP